NILEDDGSTGSSQSSDTTSALADDGGTITDETTEANEATADDMTLLPVTPVVDDAYYFAYDAPFDKLDLNISTAGAGSWTILWEYFNGSSWAALSGVTDGTTGFTVGGNNEVSWTLPSDWAESIVYQDALSAAIALDDPAYTDETTEANDASADDITLLPAVPEVEDMYYFGYSSPFDRLILNVGTAGAGSWVIAWEYWNGNTWELLPDLTDGTDAFTTVGTNDVAFTQPTDWMANTINAQGPFYYIRARVDIFTSITTQPLGTQAWIVPTIDYYVRARVSAYSSITTQPLGQQVTINNKITDANYSSGGSYTTVTLSAAEGEVDLFEWALTGSQIEATQGPFRFFGRTRETTHWDQDASYSIVIKYGTDVLYQSEWRKPVDTFTELLDLGTIYLPPWLVGTPTSLAGLTIALRAKRDVIGVTTLSLDYIALMPQDGGYRILEYRTTGVAQFEETVDRNNTLTVKQVYNETETGSASYNITDTGIGIGNVILELFYYDADGVLLFPGLTQILVLNGSIFFNGTIDYPSSFLLWLSQVSNNGTFVNANRTGDFYFVGFEIDFTGLPINL
ncbi:hypothetical protein LCGC14_2142420, partial [marine sediment metagenome]